MTNFSVTGVGQKGLARIEQLIAEEERQSSNVPQAKRKPNPPVPSNQDHRQSAQHSSNSRRYNNPGPSGRGQNGHQQSRQSRQADSAASVTARQQKPLPLSSTHEKPSMQLTQRPGIGGGSNSRAISNRGQESGVNAAGKGGLKSALIEKPDGDPSAVVIQRLFGITTKEWNELKDLGRDCIKTHNLKERDRNGDPILFRGLPGNKIMKAKNDMLNDRRFNRFLRQAKDNWLSHWILRHAVNDWIKYHKRRTKQEDNPANDFDDNHGFIESTQYHDEENVYQKYDDSQDEQDDIDQLNNDDTNNVLDDEDNESWGEGGDDLGDNPTFSPVNDETNQYDAEDMYRETQKPVEDTGFVDNDYFDDTKLEEPIKDDDEIYSSPKLPPQINTLSKRDAAGRFQSSSSPSIGGMKKRQLEADVEVIADDDDDYTPEEMAEALRLIKRLKKSKSVQPSKSHSPQQLQQSNATKAPRSTPMKNTDRMQEKPQTPPLKNKPQPSNIRRPEQGTSATRNQPNQSRNSASTNQGNANSIVSAARLGSNDRSGNTTSSATSPTATVNLSSTDRMTVDLIQSIRAFGATEYTYFDWVPSNMTYKGWLFRACKMFYPNATPTQIEGLSNQCIFTYKTRIHGEETVCRRDSYVLMCQRATNERRKVYVGVFNAGSNKNHPNTAKASDSARQRPHNFNDHIDQVGPSNNLTGNRTHVTGNRPNGGSSVGSRNNQLQLPTNRYRGSPTESIANVSGKGKGRVTANAEDSSAKPKKESTNIKTHPPVIDLTNTQPNEEIQPRQSPRDSDTSQSAQCLLPLIPSSPLVQEAPRLKLNTVAVQTNEVTDSGHLSDTTFSDNSTSVSVSEFERYINKYNRLKYKYAQLWVATRGIRNEAGILKLLDYNDYEQSYAQRMNGVYTHLNLTPVNEEESTPIRYIFRKRNADEEAAVQALMREKKGKRRAIEYGGESLGTMSKPTDTNHVNVNPISATTSSASPSKPSNATVQPVQTLPAAPRKLPAKAIDAAPVAQMGYTPTRKQQVIPSAASTSSVTVASIVQSTPPSAAEDKKGTFLDRYLLKGLSSRAHDTKQNTSDRETSTSSESSYHSCDRESYDAPISDNELRNVHRFARKHVLEIMDSPVGSQAENDCGLYNSNTQDDEYIPETQLVQVTQSQLPPANSRSTRSHGHYFPADDDLLRRLTGVYDGTQQSQTTAHLYHECIPDTQLPLIDEELEDEEEEEEEEDGSYRDRNSAESRAASPELGTMWNTQNQGQGNNQYQGQASYHYQQQSSTQARHVLMPTPPSSNFGDVSQNAAAFVFAPPTRRTWISIREYFERSAQYRSPSHTPIPSYQPLPAQQPTITPTQGESSNTHRNESAQLFASDDTEITEPGTGTPEPESNTPEGESGTPEPPAKRGRGRPKGSKNKKRKCHFTKRQKQVVKSGGISKPLPPPTAIVRKTKPRPRKKVAPTLPLRKSTRLRMETEKGRQFRIMCETKLAAKERNRVIKERKEAMNRARQSLGKG
ncbi:hypothetical protein DFH27DRAFT_633534 [Peziza echinospora]|nr:hypothetical protein DFH27DRAFT_633534 [Peziza echinospora]